MPSFRAAFALAVSRLGPDHIGLRAPPHPFRGIDQERTGCARLKRPRQPVDGMCDPVIDATTHRDTAQLTDQWLKIAAKPLRPLWTACPEVALSNIPLASSLKQPILSWRHFGNAQMNVSVESQPGLPELLRAITNYILSNNPSRFTVDTLPRDESLMELGVLDSAGVIELIVFVEAEWDIEITDDDITKERMGSLNKLAALVREHIIKKA